HRVLVVCSKPAKLLAIYSESGTIVAAEETCGDADDVWLDDKTGHVYVSGGEGFISVHGRNDADHWPQMQKIPTRGGARTSFFDSEKRKLHIAARGSDKEEAAILVFEVK